MIFSNEINIDSMNRKLLNNNNNNNNRYRNSSCNSEISSKENRSSCTFSLSSTNQQYHQQQQQQHQSQHRNLKFASRNYKNLDNNTNCSKLANTNNKTKRFSLYSNSLQSNKSSTGSSFSIVNHKTSTTSLSLPFKNEILETNCQYDNNSNLNEPFSSMSLKSGSRLIYSSSINSFKDMSRSIKNIMTSSSSSSNKKSNDLSIRDNNSNNNRKTQVAPVMTCFSIFNSNEMNDYSNIDNYEYEKSNKKTN
jgi:hypothetical protein